MASKVLVVGDVILDHYWFGNVTRISPEAPVPIVNIESNEYRLGGAGNVAQNVVAQDVQCLLLTAFGLDSNGGTLRACLSGIPTVGAADHKTTTITKLRIVSGGQHMLRVDDESPPSEPCINKVMADYRLLMPDYDIVVVSDYDKGLLSASSLQEMIMSARSLGKTVLVDTKKGSFSPIRGASVITPNLHEFERAANLRLSDMSEESITDCATKVMDEYDISNILLTRGADGMTLFSSVGTRFNILSEARDVYDVTGAGDTVIATLAAELAKGSDVLQSAIVANAAAGIAVSHFGTVAITNEDIHGEEKANGN